MRRVCGGAAERSFFAELLQERLAGGVLDQGPELGAVGRTTEEADRNAEAALVATTTAEGLAALVVTERLLDPKRRIDAR